MEVFWLLAIAALVPGAFAIDVKKREDFAYQVSLRKDGKHICGGAIYSSKHILTAASCVNDTKPEHFVVVTGNLKLNSIPQFRNVSKITKHASYSGKNPQYNVAILELKVALKLDRNTTTVQIAKKSGDLKMCVVSGWGANGTTAATENLGQFNLTKFGTDSSICKNKGFVSNVLMCAGYNIFQNPCVDDLGGPLVCNNTLYGLNSWRHAVCNMTDNPGMYTNMAYFANWISATTSAAATTQTAIWLSVTALLLSVFSR